MNRTLRKPDRPLGTPPDPVPGKATDGLAVRFLRLTILVLLIVSCVPDRASAETESESGVVTTKFGYIGDGLVNASGGIRTGSAYLQNIDATVTIDVGRFCRIPVRNLIRLPALE